LLQSLEGRKFTVFQRFAEFPPSLILWCSKWFHRSCWIGRRVKPSLFFGKRSSICMHGNTYRGNEGHKHCSKSRWDTTVKLCL